MIELKFYRDDEYVYYNNPNGITKKMPIAEFEAVMNGSGGGGSGVTFKVLSFSYNGDKVNIEPNKSETFFDFEFRDENGDVFNIGNYVYESASFIGSNIPSGLGLITYSLPVGDFGFSISLFNFSTVTGQVNINGINGQLIVVNAEEIGD